MTPIRAIKVKYLPCTNFKPSRLVASAGKGCRAVISYDCADRRDERYQKAARKLCEKMGWKGKLLCGWIENDAYFVFDGDDSITV